MFQIRYKVIVIFVCQFFVKDGNIGIMTAEPEKFDIICTDLAGQLRVYSLESKAICATCLLKYSFSYLLMYCIGIYNYGISTNAHRHLLMFNYSQENIFFS